MGPVPELQLPMSGAAVGRRVSGDAWTPPYSGESSPSSAASDVGNLVGGERDSAAFTTDDEEGIWREEDDDQGEEVNEEQEHEDRQPDEKEDEDDESTSAVASPDQHSLVTLAQLDPEHDVPMAPALLPGSTRNQTAQRSGSGRRAASCSRYRSPNAEARRHLGNPLKGPTRSL